MTLPPVVRAKTPRWLRRLGAVVGVGYLGVVALANTGFGVSELLPPASRYFTQIACLFPNAASMAIEYRVEGWSCAERRFTELDHRPYFPIHAEDKESRFHRVGHFYRSHRLVLQSLEEYLVERHNAEAAHGAGDRGAIGGIRLLSLRIPLPSPGERVERYTWRPLSDYPEEQRKEWYWTPRSRRGERCGRVAP